MKHLSLFSLAIATLLTTSAERVLAHSVQTDYLLSGDNGLELDVTFSTGEPLANSPVKIYSPDNQSEPWMEGMTDENGKFNFIPDQAQEGDWTVQIGEFDHADILSVPVEKEGIQIDEISSNQTEAVFAQNPLTLKTLPAEAIAKDSEQPNSLGYVELLVLGATLLGGTVAVRQWKKR